MKRAEARSALAAVPTPASPASLAPVIPLRPAAASHARLPHAHHWAVVAEEHYEFGRVRAYACVGCSAVRYD